MWREKGLENSELSSPQRTSWKQEVTPCLWWKKKKGFNKIVALKHLHVPESPGGLLKHKSLDLTSESLILVGLGLENF